MGKTRLIGWVLSGLLAAFLILGSASGKLRQGEDADKMFEHIGYSAETMFRIGIVEVVITVLFLIPKTAFIGAILLTGYFGGATATHARIGEPVFVPIIIGIVTWIALGLRQPEIFHMALGNSTSLESNSEPSND